MGRIVQYTNQHLTGAGHMVDIKIYSLQKKENIDKHIFSMSSMYHCTYSYISMVSYQHISLISHDIHIVFMVCPVSFPFLHRFPMNLPGFCVFHSSSLTRLGQATNSVYERKPSLLESAALKMVSPGFGGFKRSNDGLVWKKTHQDHLMNEFFIDFLFLMNGM